MTILEASRAKKTTPGGAAHTRGYGGLSRSPYKWQYTTPHTGFLIIFILQRLMLEYCYHNTMDSFVAVDEDSTGL